MISYAQNFEDVMLNRVFGDIRDGFYIDVGASHPDIDSVTKHFYLNGWSGINLEPSDYHYKLLEARRRQDVNIKAAVSAKSGYAVFNNINGSGLSSLQVDVIERATRHGLSSSQIEVEVLTLAEVCARHVQNREIHFLKIDVEGSELDVVIGMDWKSYRPIVVLIEAIHPDTGAPAWQPWEPLMFEAGYTFVWFDGINRFYLRNEDMGYKVHFAASVSVRDGVAIYTNGVWCHRAIEKMRRVVMQVRDWFTLHLNF